MAEKISPSQIQQAAKMGFERLSAYRRARALFIKAYVGQYYQNKYGLTGDQPLNLLYNAIRIMVPNLVMQNPKNEVTTGFVQHKFYADLLGRGINFTEDIIKLKYTLRRWVVDALFGFGVMKTALNSSSNRVTIDDHIIDPGQVYADLVSLDSFTFDPACTQPLFQDASFLGHSTVVPRQQLLDVNGYDHDLVSQIPTIAQQIEQHSAKNISKDVRFGSEFASLRKLIRVVELWMPDANAIVTTPDPRFMTAPKFLRTVEHFGPDDGPYSFLSFTPPVPDNPIPVAPVSVWYDLHNVSNDMFNKIVDQALRQKDVGLYRPADADTAQDIEDAHDGEMVMSDDPNAVNTISLGGQRASNENMLTQLQTWFSYMAGNIEQLGGARSSAATATQAEILQGNANVTIEDARDIVYEGASDIGRKIGWHLFYDPLINLPLPYVNNQNEEVTIYLTPEERRGDFLDYTFKIKAKSMSRLDPTIKTQRIVEFATNIIPSAANAAMICMKMGTPFNFPKFVMGVAEEIGVADWMMEVFEDPEFMQKMQIMMMMGPQSTKAKAGGPATPAGTAQNGGFPMAQNVPTPEQQTNMDQQELPAISQEARL
jgi:hypothetical protein